MYISPCLRLQIFKKYVKYQDNSPPEIGLSFGHSSKLFVREWVISGLFFFLLAPLFPVEKYKHYHVMEKGHIPASLQYIISEKAGHAHFFPHPYE